MASSYNNTTIKQMTYNGQKVKKWYHDGVKVFSAGNVVTYHVNTDTSYQEEIDSEASCLSPTTFTPELSGYTFVGWREDTTASGEVLSEKAMGDESIDLYAVFSKSYTFSTTIGTKYATSYYNNGNTRNPVIYIWNSSASEEIVATGASCLSPTSFTPSMTGATFLGWTDNSASATAISSKVMGSEPIVLYAVWKYADTSIAISSASYEHGGHMSYGGDHTFIYGIDPTKYSHITITISARLSQDYQSSYYYVRFYVVACGKHYYLMSGGDDGDAETYGGRPTYELGTSENTFRAYTYQEHDSTGYGRMSVSDAVLTGRTVVK